MDEEKVIKKRKKKKKRRVVYVWIGVPCICIYFVGQWILFTDPSKLAKYSFLSLFGFHSTIHTFKNYFITVFLVISF